MILLGLVYIPLAVSTGVLLSISHPLSNVEFSLSEQLFGRDFSSCHASGEGSWNESEKGLNERVRKRDNQTESVGKRERRREEDDDNKEGRDRLESF